MASICSCRPFTRFSSSEANLEQGAGVGTAPYVIAANADKPYKTIGDVIEACRKEAGAVKYASVGVGTLGHLAMTVLGKRAGVEITHVAYRGGGPAMNDVLGGHVDLIAGSAALIAPQLEGGKLRPILQMGRERLALLKDTQTVTEAGFPDLETLAWWGVFATKATPADVIASTESAIRDALNDPAAAKRLQETQQMTLVLGGAKEMDAFLAKQVALWSSRWSATTTFARRRHRRDWLRAVAAQETELYEPQWRLLRHCEFEEWRRGCPPTAPACVLKLLVNGKRTLVDVLLSVLPTGPPPRAQAWPV